MTSRSILFGGLERGLHANQRAGLGHLPRSLIFRDRGANGRGITINGRLARLYGGEFRHPRGGRHGTRRQPLNGYGQFEAGEHDPFCQTGNGCLRYAKHISKISLPDLMVAKVCFKFAHTADIRVGYIPVKYEKTGGVFAPARPSVAN